MKVTLALLLCIACQQTMADTYTLVVKTELNVPGANETWNQVPVTLDAMSGTFYVGPFADLPSCQAALNADLSDMFNGATFNEVPVEVSITNSRCVMTSRLKR